MNCWEHRQHGIELLIKMHRYGDNEVKRKLKNIAQQAVGNTGGYSNVFLMLSVCDVRLGETGFFKRKSHVWRQDFYDRVTCSLKIL